jgi:hypothetical protein
MRRYRRNYSAIIRRCRRHPQGFWPSTRSRLRLPEEHEPKLTRCATFYLSITRSPLNVTVTYDVLQLNGLGNVYRYCSASKGLEMLFFGLGRDDRPPWDMLHMGTLQMSVVL